MISQIQIDNALDVLRAKFAVMRFPHSEVHELHGDILYKWPGRADEDVMICAPTFTKREPFHRHEFFYFNFTISGKYNSISGTSDKCITICEDELYAGEPHAAHALMPTGDAAKNVIIGVLIKRSTFIADFLPMLCADSSLFRFFLEPEANPASDKFLHFKMADSTMVREILFIMAMEYAAPKSDTQSVLKPLALSFLMQVERQYALYLSQSTENRPLNNDYGLYKADDISGSQDRLCDRVVRYVASHISDITLQDAAKHFSRHPAYISALVRQETGQTFSRIVQSMRMEKAQQLLQVKSISVEEVAYLVGYSNVASFYRAYKSYCGYSPRSGVPLNYEADNTPRTPLFIER